MEADEIPSKSALHPAFMAALRSVWAPKQPGGGCDDERGGDLSLPTNSKVLDLGCGDGRLSLSLVDEASAAGASVDWVGVDVCSHGVDNARQVARQRGYPEVAARDDARAGAKAAGPKQQASFEAGDVTTVDLTGVTLDGVRQGVL